MIMEHFTLVEFCKICDAHLHLADLSKLNLSLPEISSYSCISCAQTNEEFQIQSSIAQNSICKIYNAFGVHPQNPILKNIDFLETLLFKNKISAIGEIGFDFFTKEYKTLSLEQTKVFEAQLELAIKYKMPIIIHERKAIDKFFFYSNELKKLPAVIFHSYAGTYREALSLLSREINCYFSFGKQIINGNKKSIECVKSLPAKNILLETDAPFQTLKGESATFPLDIIKVYEEAIKIKGIQKNDSKSQIEFCEQLYSNFLLSLNIH